MKRFRSWTGGHRREGDNYGGDTGSQRVQPDHVSRSGLCSWISTGTDRRIFQEFSGAADGRLKDTVVLLVDSKKGQPFTFKPPTIESRESRFLSFVNVVKDRSEVHVVNMDPVFHDIQAYETSHPGPRVLFNTPLLMNPHHKRHVGADSHEHLSGQSMKEVIRMTKDRRIFVMQCGFHAYYGKVGDGRRQSTFCCHAGRWDLLAL